MFEEIDPIWASSDDYFPPSSHNNLPTALSQPVFLFPIFSHVHTHTRAHTLTGTHILWKKQWLHCTSGPPCSISSGFPIIFHICTCSLSRRLYQSSVQIFTMPKRIFREVYQSFCKNVFLSYNAELARIEHVRFYVLEAVWTSIMSLESSIKDWEDMLCMSLHHAMKVYSFL